MKHLAAVALVVVGIAIPACAQHGASHGGFSSHSSSASHGSSFHSSAPSHFTSAPRSAARTFAPPSTGQRGLAARPGARTPYTGTGSLRYRRPYVSHFRGGLAYGVGWASPGYGPGYGPGYLGYPIDSDDPGVDNSAPAQGSEQAYDGPPPSEQPLEPYQPWAVSPQPMSAPADQEAVTLVFTDGRPTEQIHNYMLTRNTLFVLDERHRDIPLDQLDLAATAKVNRDAGIEFRLPQAPGQ